MSKTFSNEPFLPRDFSAWQERAGDTAHFVSPLADIDGFSRAPLYVADAKAAPRFIRDEATWKIAARVILGRETSNKSVLTEVEGGANVLLLDFSEGAGENLSTLLSGVMLDVISLSVAPTQMGLTAIQAVLALPIPKSSPLFLNYDPIGAHILYGEALKFEVLNEAQENVFTMTGSGAAFHNAGANSVQELGWGISSLVEYMRRGVPLTKMTLTLASDVDFFTTISKIRAARWMLASIADAMDTVAPPIHVETSLRSFSNADPWTNILRGTISTMGAAIGGADVICVAPCTATATQDNTLTRRLARNTQLILQEETHLDSLRDAAAGSWYVEQMTHELAEAAWKEFQAIETSGGIISALQSGSIAARLQEQKERMAELVAKRQWQVVGTSIFPNLGEAVLETATNVGFRAATPFESMRAAAAPHKPSVYLACIGNEAEFTARANFASDLYAAAGIVSVVGHGGTDTEAITSDFKQSEARIAVICGTDKAHEEHAKAVANALHNAGCTHIALAGKIEVEGVDDNIFMGMDVLKFLNNMCKRLGLSDE